MKIFFDENFSPYLAEGFACFQNGRKSENIKVLHIAPGFGRGVTDEEWIPAIAKKHAMDSWKDIKELAKDTPRPFSYIISPKSIKPSIL